ncbi:hypothetical protein P43SY_004305 [Pythium insidiosum]|uniref:Uncharacterized protein n=1 Tax=Pythium insidiosum TaxID=114742 RepID=A0AAD5M4I2_PYTIN|nr:hypothetical protein P43SY_004305 [Pythium insidiosum]
MRSAMDMDDVVDALPPAIATAVGAPRVWRSLRPERRQVPRDPAPARPRRVFHTLRRMQLTGSTLAPMHEHVMEPAWQRGGARARFQTIADLPVAFLEALDEEEAREYQRQMTFNGHKRSFALLIRDIYDIMDGVNTDRKQLRRIMLEIVQRVLEPNVMHGAPAGGADPANDFVVAEREKFLRMGGAECLLRVGILRELCYFSIDLARDLSDKDGLIVYLFQLMHENKFFDNAAGLVEDILAVREDSFDLSRVPRFNDIVQSFSSRQLAFFTRVLALVVFEPEDRRLLETSKVIKSIELLQLRRSRLLRTDSVVDRNHAIIFNCPVILQRLLTVLEVQNYYFAVNPVTQFANFMEVVIRNLVDSNVFVRSMLLSAEKFAKAPLDGTFGMADDSAMDQLTEFDHLMGWSFRDYHSREESAEDDELDAEYLAAKHQEHTRTAFDTPVRIPDDFVAPSLSLSPQPSPCHGKGKKKKSLVHSRAYSKRATGQTASSAAKHAARSRRHEPSDRSPPASASAGRKTVGLTSQERPSTSPVTGHATTSKRNPVASNSELRALMDAERRELQRRTASREAELRAANRWVFDKRDASQPRKVAWHLDAESKRPAAPPSLSPRNGSSSRMPGPAKTSVAPNVSDWRPQARPSHPSRQDEREHWRRRERERQEQQRQRALAEDVSATIDAFEERMERWAL